MVEFFHIVETSLAEKLKGIPVTKNREDAPDQCQTIMLLPRKKVIAQIKEIQNKVDNASDQLTKKQHQENLKAFKQAVWPELTNPIKRTFIRVKWPDSCAHEDNKRILRDKNGNVYIPLV